jgi:hypothetical protein
MSRAGCPRVPDPARAKPKQHPRHAPNLAKSRRTRGSHAIAMPRCGPRRARRARLDAARDRPLRVPGGTTEFARPSPLLERGAGEVVDDLKCYCLQLMPDRYFGTLCVVSVITITGACAGRGATSSPIRGDGDALAREGGTSAHGLEDSDQCEVVTFTRATGTANGLLACFTASYPADIVVASPEPCEGRGLGELLVGAGRCSSSADCPANSECSPSGLCHNRPECENDSGCGSGEACACAGLVVPRQSGVFGFNQCVPVQCRSSADCAGYSCGASESDDCGVVDGYYCHSESDECFRNSDCDTGSLCAYDGGMRSWRCILPPGSCDRYL